MHIEVRSIVCVGALWIGVQACGHSQPGQRTQPTAPAPAAQRKPAAEHSPAPPPDVPAPMVEPKVDHHLEPALIEEYMSDHFRITNWTRDAVAEGDLEAVREPLVALADHEYAPDVPEAWMPRILQLQAAARVTARAPTLTAAAHGIATMASICGQCHLDLGQSLPLEAAQVESQAPKDDDVSTRMFRHFWAIERLWEGLMAPSDQAWSAGASALIRAPLRTPKPESPAPHKFAEALEQLRQLGTRASAAASPKARSEIYAVALASCADCHAKNSVFEREALLSLPSRRLAQNAP